ncbi:MAG: EI24 domain-containing protein [Deltaproteobacteria bacterium]|nr:EI24 domain-containing protein [Deltaproteobacteria bacterium]MBN2671526.1 EI24 domain-containing protein [Deltaproteobacteria bacterium]
MLSKQTVNSFRSGVSAFFRGQQYVFSRHPELLKYGLIPMMLGGVVLAGLGILFFFGFDDLASWIWEKPESVWLQVGWMIFYALTFVLSMATTVLLAFLAFMIICAPFNDVLSEQVESLEGTFEAQPFRLGFVLKDAGYSVALETRKVLGRLLWLVPLYLFSVLVPVVGQLVYVVVGGYKMSLSLGMEYVDWSLARRGYSASDRFDFAAAHRSALLGFGAMMTLCSLVPLGAILVWPGAVAGGTLLCAGLTAQDERKDGTGLLSVSNAAEARKRE